MAVEPGAVRRNDGGEGVADIVLGAARPEIADGDAAGKPDCGKLDRNGRGRVAGVEDREVFVLRSRDIGDPRDEVPVSKSWRLPALAWFTARTSSLVRSASVASSSWVISAPRMSGERAMDQRVIMVRYRAGPTR
jgi:hypothetical protein